MQSNDEKCVVVTTTLSGEEKAHDLARRLVESRLCACVHCLPVHSTYRWRGQVETAAEYVLQCKTTRVLADRLQQTMAELHSYEVPEITVTPILDGAPSYLAWIREETGEQQDS